MKKTLMLTMTAILYAAATSAVWAEGAAATTKVVDGGVWFFGLTVLGAGLAVGLGTVGTGVGMGSLVGKALEAMARQPEMLGTIQTNMIIGLAFVESLCIYALSIAMILLYANPFKGFFIAG